MAETIPIDPIESSGFDSEGRPTKDGKVMAMLSPGSSPLTAADFAIPGEDYPPYKIVNLFRKGSHWTTWCTNYGLPVASGLQLYLETPFASGTKSTYKDPFDAFKEKLKEWTSGLGKGISQGIVSGVEKASALGRSISDASSMWNGFIESKGKSAIAGVQKNLYSNVKAWENTEPLSFSMTFKFYMGMTGAYSGKTEVFNPIMGLVKMTLPTVKDGFIVPPGIGIYQAFSLMAEGFFSEVMTGLGIKGATSPETARISDSTLAADRLKLLSDGSTPTPTDPAEAAAAAASGGGGSGSLGSTAVLSSASGNIFTSLAKIGTGEAAAKKIVDAGSYFSLSIGKTYAPLITIRMLQSEDLSFSFSNEFDNQGYPISGEVTIKFSTVTMAHTGAILIGSEAG